MAVVAHLRAVRDATAAENVDPARAVTRVTGLLLRVHFATSERNFRAPLYFVSAAATLGELPVDHTGENILTRRQAIDMVGQFNGSGLLGVKGQNINLHGYAVPYSLACASAGACASAEACASAAALSVTESAASSVDAAAAFTPAG